MGLSKKYQETFNYSMKFLIVFIPLFTIGLLFLDWRNTITLNIPTSQFLLNALFDEIGAILVYFIVGKMIKK